MGPSLTPLVLLICVHGIYLLLFTPGSMALECYTCDVLTNPSRCNIISQCGLDQMCMLHESGTGSDGMKRYKSSCTSRIVCAAIASRGKRNEHVFCHNCCDTDLCNNHCGGSSTSIPIPVPTTHAPTTHAGSGLQCFNCDVMNGPGTCRHAKTCPSGHVCMAIYNTIGKRNSARGSTPGCVRCCYQDLCNDHCVAAPQSTIAVPTHKITTTHQPTTTTTTTTTTTPKPTTTTTPKPTTTTTTPKPTTTTTTPKPTTTTPKPTTTTTHRPTTTHKPTTHRPHTHGHHTPTVPPTTTLECYSCGNMADPGACRHIVTCLAGHVCMIRTQSYSFLHNEYRYTSSCERTKICHEVQHLSIGSHNCTSCCNTDRCNNVCDATQITTPAATHHPHTLSRLICYSCEHMTSQHDCHHAAVCGEDEVCVLYETEHSEDGTKISYNSKCGTIKACQSMNYLATFHDLYSSHAFCHSCCDSMMCNNDCSVSLSLTTPVPTQHPTHHTTVPTTTEDPDVIRARCETHNYVYIPYAHVCFKFHFEHSTWQRASITCRSEGGMLAKLDRTEIWDTIHTLVTIEQHYRTSHVYIGGTSSFGNSTFYWADGESMTSQFLHHNGVSYIHNGCLILNHRNNYHLQITSCSQSLQYICTKIL